LTTDTGATKYVIDEFGVGLAVTTLVGALLVGLRLAGAGPGAGSVLVPGREEEVGESKEGPAGPDQPLRPGREKIENRIESD
jgi:hypothetical protein